MTGIILFGILTVLLILAGNYGIHTYNRLISEQLKVDNQWSQVDIVLKQRNDTIPNLVNIVEGYAVHEKDLLENVTQARNQYMQAANPEEALRGAADLRDAMGKFFAVAENYPELKANESFLDLQQKYYSLEAKAADFRQFYNDTVMRYNRLVMSFPSSLVAKLCHFEKRSFFEAGEDLSQSPEIRF